MRSKVVVLVIALLIPAALAAQVAVEISSNKIVSGGKSYYLHTVTKGQTLYSISRAYKVPIESITDENGIASATISEGQVLRIPFVESGRTIISDNKKNPIGRPATGQAAATPATATPAQSAPAQSAPAQSAATTTATAPAVVPPVITVSSKKEVRGGKVYFIHDVQKGQTLYSLARTYRISIDEIVAENEFLASGLQAGQVLLIPETRAMAASVPQAQPVKEEEKPVQQAAPPQQNKPADNAKPAAQQQSQQSQPQQQAQTLNQHQDGAAGQQQTQPKGETTTTVAASAKEETAAADKPDTSQGAQAASSSKQQTNGNGNGKERPKTHKVQKGESLSDIAGKYGISVHELKQANKGLIFITPGMKLAIPPLSGNGDGSSNGSGQK